MSKANDILDKTKRGEPDAKKWKVVVGIVVGLVFGGALFVGGMTCLLPVLDSYFQENKEITNLYDFYDLKLGHNTTAVYFIGASHVAESVYPAEINRLLSEMGYENVTVYTIYVSQEGPLDRLVHLKKLIESRPSLVIYGIAEESLMQDSLNEDNILIVQDRLDVPDNIKQFYTSDELLLFETKDLWKMKRFLRNAATSLLATSIREDMYNYDYTSDPLSGPESRKHIAEMRYDAALIDDLRNSEKYTKYYNITESSRTVKAFNYILDSLDNEGIDVAVVNVPINPLRSDIISQESRENFFEILNNTGYNWYDLEYSISEEYYFDGTHTTFEGALLLAPIWADIIVQELS